MALRDEVMTSLDRIGREALGGAWTLVRPTVAQTIRGFDDARLRRLLDVIHAESTRLKGVPDRAS